MRKLAIGKAFNEGRTIEELAREFNIKAERVLEYLFSYYREGNPLRAEGFLPLISLPALEVEKATKAFEEIGPGLLRPVFEALSGEIGYEDLRILRLYYLALQNRVGGSEDGSCEKREQVSKIICLANSRKYAGRCIAGKELTGDEVGAWIRPVSGASTGELSLQDIALPSGKMPNLLDIVTVPLREAVPHTYQSENHLIGGTRWGCSGTWAVSRAGALCDEVDRLWINGFHSHGGLNDRMPVQVVEKSLSSSLCFIRPEGLSITVEEGPKGLNRVRARFAFKGETYWLTVTDPLIEARYLPKIVGDYPVDSAQPYMTVSIGEPFEGFCYKLAAAIIL